MKDAKGHGSDSKGGGYAEATAAVAHQTGVQQVGRTPEDHIAAGGKIPTEAQYKDLQDRNQTWLRGWLDGRSVDEALKAPTTTEFGKRAIGRLQAELEQSKTNYAKFGSEENPSALTRSLRKQVN
jgi:hypothetical protein